MDINPPEYFQLHKNDYSLSVNPNFLPSSLKYSLVIPTFARSPFEDVTKNPLYWTLAAALEGKLLPEEIIVVDNTSTTMIDYSNTVCQQIEKIIISNKISTKIAYHKTNEKGAATARNIGIDKAKNNFIHLIDDDCIIHKETSLVAFYILDYLNKKNPELYGKIALFCLPQNKRATIPAKLKTLQQITVFDLENFNFTGTISSTFPNEYLNKDQQYLLTRPLMLDNFQGGNAIIFKDKINQAGNYPEYKAPITYGEETGLAFNIKKHGFTIIYYPFFNLQAVHLSFGNPNPPFELVGDNWTFRYQQLKLADLVRQSCRNIVDTGARVENFIYFYAKIYNFAQILQQFNNNYVERWFSFVAKVFVEENDPAFLDGKTPLTDKNKRQMVLRLAQNDYRIKDVQSKEKLRSIFNNR